MHFICTEEKFRLSMAVKLILCILCSQALWHCNSNWTNGFNRSYFKESSCKTIWRHPDNAGVVPLKWRPISTILQGASSQKKIILVWTSEFHVSRIVDITGGIVSTSRKKMYFRLWIPFTHQEAVLKRERKYRKYMEDLNILANLTPFALLQKQQPQENL